jgi:putative ABC transport system permease protein
MRLVLIEAAVVGILGSGIGLATGSVLAGGLIKVTQLFLEQEMSVVPPLPSDIIGSFLVGLAVTLLAAAIPALQASQVSPLQALRVRGNRREGWIVNRGWIAGIILIAVASLTIYVAAQNKAIVLYLGSAAVFALFLGVTLLIPATMPFWERLIRPLARQLYGNEGRLGSSNIQRARLRSAFTATALVVGVAMILAVQGLTAAFKSDIENWLNAYIGGDHMVYSSTTLRPELATRLTTVEGVAAATPVRFVEMQFANPTGEWESAVFTAVEPRSYQTVGSFVFSQSGVNTAALMSQLEQGETVFISSVVAERTGLGQGDKIRIRTRRGEQEFAIAAVVVDFYNRGLVVEGGRQDLRRYFGMDDASLLLLRVKPGQDVAQVANRIRDTYGDREHLTVSTNESIKSSALKLSDQSFALFNVLAMIAVVVAAFGLVNTLTVSVTERTREIGALRGVGMTRWQIRRMVLAEAGAIGLVGGIIGLVFGLFLARILIIVMAVFRSYQLPYIIPSESIIITLILALLVSQLAAIWPAHRAAKLRIIEAIQYE